jgi:hypothetical protein
MRTATGTRVHVSVDRAPIVNLTFRGYFGMVDGYVYTYRGPAGGSEPLMAVCITSITIVEKSSLLDRMSRVRAVLAAG